MSIFNKFGSESTLIFVRCVALVFLALYVPIGTYNYLLRNRYKYLQGILIDNNELKCAAMRILE